MSGKNVSDAATAHGFEIELSQPVPEIGGMAHVMRHDTGARLLFLENDDNNKGFSITFKTPASDDTGVFHILEHSVLCGSEKYPVKEPFVNLLKSSMQTFLNAMTFPDKTMYPVSSTNNKDLKNLASVYLDAVFHPNIYSNKRIFEQEGWHLEVDPDDGSLAYNGVVFNEMKGGLSDSDWVLFDVLCQSLFPDTTYRFESGGAPEAIPTLRYEDFLDSHRRHYRPSNSYIVLYGNLDIDDFLELVDENLRNASNEDAAINPLEMQRPVVKMGVKHEMVTSPDNSCAAIGFVAARSDECERVAALQILLDAIMGSNEAPMKKALLDADIADELEGAPATSMLQPFVAISARGLHGDDAAKRLNDEVIKEAKRLSEGGLDKELVDAALNHAEFAMREGNFGMADGVHYSMSAMNGWLYDDSPESALLYICYEKVIEDLRAKLETSYYEDLLKEVFLENDHMASAEIVPVEAEGDTVLDERLKDLKDSLTPSQLDDVAEEAEALHEAQMAPDSPEALKTLPRLSRKDVDDPPADIPFEISSLGPVKVLRHDIETHGIVYVSRYFDLRCLSFEDLVYASILSLVLGKMDTKRHSAAQIDTLTQSKLGSLTFSCETYSTSEDADGIKPYLVVRASCLKEKVSDMATLVNEIITETVFSDTDRLENILTQFKVGKEQQFIMSGDSVASTRAASHLFPSQAVIEHMGNIDFYRCVKRILGDYDANAKDVLAKLQEVSLKVFTDDGCLLSFAGPDGTYEKYCEKGGKLDIRSSSQSTELVVPPLKAEPEAFAVPADIAYCALVGNRSVEKDGKSDFSGIWMMASRVLSYDYLWNEVRVVGGAYGVKFTSSRKGVTSFSSFRDPHIRETLERFRATDRWLAEYDPQDGEFEGFVVSTAASFDKPLKARALINRQTSMYLSDYDYAEYLSYRSQVLDASLDDLKKLSDQIREICDSGNVCIVGNRGLIDQSDMGIPVIDLFDI